MIIAGLGYVNCLDVEISIEITSNVGYYVKNLKRKVISNS